MLLVLDAGNTRLKWGLHDGERWLAQSATGYDALDALTAAVLHCAVVSRVIGVNVAGARVRNAIETALAAIARPIEWNSPRHTQCGVTCAYDAPAQLGADRWAALIGARARVAAAAVVASAGTALTVDALTADGLFLGGLILPGLRLMRDGLADHTAQLPRADGTFAYFPANTADAIASGALNAECGAIERMTQYLEATAGVAPQIVLSGGDAQQLAPLLAGDVTLVDNLVLEGLLAIARDDDTVAPAAIDTTSS